MSSMCRVDCGAGKCMAISNGETGAIGGWGFDFRSSMCNEQAWSRDVVGVGCETEHR